MPWINIPNPDNMLVVDVLFADVYSSFGALIESKENQLFPIDYDSFYVLDQMCLGHLEKLKQILFGNHSSQNPFGL